MKTTILRTGLGALAISIAACAAPTDDDIGESEEGLVEAAPTLSLDNNGILTGNALPALSQSGNRVAMVSREPLDASEAHHTRFMVFGRRDDRFSMKESFVVQRAVTTTSGVDYRLDRDKLGAANKLLEADDWLRLQKMPQPSPGVFATKRYVVRLTSNEDTLAIRVDFEGKQNWKRFTDANGFARKEPGCRFTPEIRVVHIAPVRGALLVQIAQKSALPSCMAPDVVRVFHLG